jgi:hypothetical protein
MVLNYNISKQRYTLIPFFTSRQEMNDLLKSIDLHSQENHPLIKKICQFRREKEDQLQNLRNTLKNQQKEIQTLSCMNQNLTNQVSYLTQQFQINKEEYEKICVEKQLLTYQMSGLQKVQLQFNQAEKEKSYKIKEISYY